MIQTSVFFTDPPVTEKCGTQLRLAHHPPKQGHKQEGLVMLLGHVLMADLESPVN